jgi:uncharacterized protein
MILEIEYDDKKNTRNIELRGLNFALASKVDHDNLIIFIDKRKNYGETRKICIAMIEKELYYLVYVKRNSKYRIISLRITNKKERAYYEQKTRPFSD